jgi:hypothetical protein
VLVPLAAQPAAAAPMLRELGDAAVVAGFAVLIIRTRVKEG